MRVYPYWFLFLILFPTLVWGQTTAAVGRTAWVLLNMSVLLAANLHTPSGACFLLRKPMD